MRPCRQEVLASLLLSASLLVGCALLPHADVATPHDLRAVRMDQLPAPAQAAQLALVLGGGGLRGFAHLGILQALD